MGPFLGQYLDGTTDVTRTWVCPICFIHKQMLDCIDLPSAHLQHFGTPSEKEIRAFTRVLQGHISIDTAIFPSGESFILTCSARPMFLRLNFGLEELRVTSCKRLI